MRHRESLATSYRALGRVGGFVLLLLGGLHLVPLALLLAFPEEKSAAGHFLIPAAAAAGAGALLLLVFRNARPGTLTLRYGVLVTCLAWTTACLMSAAPFALHGESWRNALFESVSGWSTTGLSIIDLESVGPLLLFWRAFLQLLGGAGLILVMASALAGPWATGLYQAEGHGEPFLPHMGRTSRAILGIYLGYTVLGIGAFLVAGLPLFEAATHSMTSLATGGFSTRAAGLGSFESPAVEGVAIVLMVLGQLNFMIHFLLLRGRWRAALRQGEVKVFLVALLLGVGLLYWGAARPLWGSDPGLRRALFQAVSALSGTGFSIAPDGEWNGVGAAVLIGLMLIGGGVNSTAGALKQHRVYLVFKSVQWQVRQFFLPRSAVFVRQIWRGEERIVLEPDHLRGVATYVVFYLLVWSFGSLVLMGYGVSMQGALFEFASALGGVGLSAGITTPAAPGGILYTEMAGMFLGRLEFFIVILGVGKILVDLRDAWRDR